MRICHVSRSLCPRMVKLAQTQQDAGFETMWIGERPQSFQRTVPFKNQEIGMDLRFGGLQLAIRKMNDRADIFHVHTHLRDINILEEILEHATRPYVWDCHDEPPHIPPRAPTSRLAPTVRLIGVDGIDYQTYCPRAWFHPPRPYTMGLVIATGLANVPGHFRYWLDTFAQIKKLGLSLTCYTFSEIPAEYRDVADMRPPIDLRQLIANMSLATAGLCGSPHPDANMLSAFPNKLYEYLAAGIPVICLGRKHDMATMIEDLRIGVAIDDILELPEALKTIERNNCRETVFEIRGAFAMEQELPKVMQFYRTVRN